MSYGHHHHPEPHHQPSGPYGNSGPSALPQTVGHANVTEIKGTVYYIFAEANSKVNLAVKGNSIIVEKADPSDPTQQWIKDESWANKAKDSAGKPAFALINKATGRALAHPKEAEQQVYLTTYHQKTLNEDYLWTLGKDEGHAYHAVRPVNNINLNLDVDHGSKKYGGVTEGKPVIVFTWKGEDNQKWQLKPVDDHGKVEHHHFHF